jgi:hypothetical protein
MRVPLRRRYPAVPSDIIQPNDIGGLNRMFSALRERVEIFARERGTLDDSMVRVDDLIKLGLITRADLDKLKD